jgi:hypothetical protein
MASGDDGSPDPSLRAALIAAEADRVLALLPQSRLLVPVVALPAAGEAEMAVPALVNADGARALPVFSGLDALHAWQPDARPVPMPGERVLLAAAAEGYDGVVVDVAGPAAFTLQADQIRRLAPSRDTDC